MTQQKADQQVEKDRFPETADTASGQLKEATEDTEELAGRVTEQARGYGEKAQDAARKVKPLVEKSLKEQPMTTVATAAIVGFVLGALWKK